MNNQLVLYVTGIVKSSLNVVLGLYYCTGLMSAIPPRSAHSCSEVRQADQGEMLRLLRVHSSCYMVQAPSPLYPHARVASCLPCPESALLLLLLLPSLIPYPALPTLSVPCAFCLIDFVSSGLRGSPAAGTRGPPRSRPSPPSRSPPPPRPRPTDPAAPSAAPATRSSQDLQSDERGPGPGRSSGRPGRPLAALAAEEATADGEGDGQPLDPDDLTQINCTVTIFTGEKTRVIGLISEWINTYHFMKRKYDDRRAVPALSGFCPLASYVSSPASGRREGGCPRAPDARSLDRRSETTQAINRVK